LDKENKDKKEMPEDPVEQSMGEEKIQDKAEEAVEESKTEEQTKNKENTEEKKEEIAEEVEKTNEVKVEENVKEKTTEKPEEIKEEKTEKKPEKKEKRPDRGPDFKYIVRLSNTDVDGEKNLIYGLTSIKGIGMKIAMLVAKESGIDVNKKIGNLSDKEIEILQKEIDEIENKAPTWMLNHRKDLETGEDIHLIGSDIDMRLRDEINILKKIRSYKGIRHERGLRARGQRTKANNRSGLTLGVSKSKQK